jgi:hypothetical protein
MCVITQREMREAVAAAVGAAPDTEMSIIPDNRAVSDHGNRG